MKFEWKIVIMGMLFSVFCILLFTYGTSLSQKTIYVYQVGIYKEENNKDDKLSELKEQGIEGCYYQKDDQYYVLSIVSEDQKAVEEQATKIKGIMKSYQVDSQTSTQELLDNLAKGVSHD